MTAAGCGSSSGGPTADKPTRASDVAAANVSIPPFGPFDTGVLSDISMQSHGARSELSAIDANLRTCEQVAPGRWLLRGDVTSVPVGTPAPAVMNISFDRADMSQGVTVRATVAGKGPFTLPIDLLASAETHAVSAWAIEANGCAIDTGSGKGGYAPTTASAAPIAYTAPAGTVQALGIGARMNERDDKFSWAYFAWSRIPSPFAELWIPPPAPGPFRLASVYEQDDNDTPTDCATFTYTVGETNVTQTSGCRRLDGLSNDPVVGAPTFRWQYARSDHSSRSAVLMGDGFQVVVFDRDVQRMVAVAASLRPVRALVVDPAATAPSHSLAQVIASGRNQIQSSEDEFGAIGELTERARIRRGDVTTVVFTGHFAHACGNCEDGLVAYLDVYRSNGRWRADDDGGSGSFDDCLSISSGFSSGKGGDVRAIAGDPKWTIDVLDPATWHATDIVNGVWIQEYPAMTASPPIPRVVVRDAHGKVVPCSESAQP